MPTKKVKAKVKAAVKKSTPKKKVAAKKAAVKAVPAVKKTTMPVPSEKPAKKIISAEEKFKLIEKEAFILAEKEGFRGDPLHYWLAAENIVGLVYR
jgi:hypothetical protein